MIYLTAVRGQHSKCDSWRSVSLSSQPTSVMGAHYNNFTTFNKLNLAHTPSLAWIILLKQPRGDLSAQCLCFDIDSFYFITFFCTINEYGWRDKTMKIEGHRLFFFLFFLLYFFFFSVFIFFFSKAKKCAALLKNLDFTPSPEVRGSEVEEVARSSGGWGAPWRTEGFV